MIAENSNRQDGASVKPVQLPGWRSSDASSRRRSGPHRIVATGDFLRPIDGGFRPSQSENIRWFHSLFRRPMAEASGLPVELVTWGRGVDATAFYEACEASPDTGGWTAIYDAPALPDEALEQLEAAFGGCVVIGFELAKSVKLGLDRLGIPFVDFNIHPVRFLDDVFFAAESNDERLCGTLARWHEHEHRFWRAADIVVAACQKLPKPTLAADTLLLGQMAVDRSLIRNGRLVDLSDFRQEVDGWVGRRDPILYKAHPYNPGDFGVYELGRPFTSIHPVKANAYVLLAQDELKRVVTVSSSVAFEARFFEKKGHLLMASPFDIVDDGTDMRPFRHASIVKGLFDVDFWRDLFEPLVPVTARDGDRFTQPPHLLRTTLRNFWGFNEIATDIVPILYEQGKAVRGG